MRIRPLQWTGHSEPRSDGVALGIEPPGRGEAFSRAGHWAAYSFGGKITGVATKRGRIIIVLSFVASMLYCGICEYRESRACPELCVSAFRISDGKPSFEM